MNILEFQGPNRWLSNFYPCVVHYDGDEYPSVENAYQAAKTVVKEEREYLQKCTPAQAKRFKKTVRPEWCTYYRNTVMLFLLSQKFNQKEFHDNLLSTGISHISEGNRWNDTYWGVDLNTGEGQNMLGQMIMNIRLEKQLYANNVQQHDGIINLEEENQ